MSGNGSLNSSMGMSDLLSTTLDELEHLPDCDQALLAILKSHIVKLDTSESAVGLAFEEIKVLADKRAYDGDTDA